MILGFLGAECGEFGGEFLLGLGEASTAEDVEAKITAALDPFVVLFGQDRSDGPDQGADPVGGDLAVLGATDGFRFGIHQRVDERGQYLPLQVSPGLLELFGQETGSVNKMECGHRVYSCRKDLIDLSKNYAVAASHRCNTPVRTGDTPRYWTQPTTHRDVTLDAPNSDHRTPPKCAEESYPIDDYLCRVDDAWHRSIGRRPRFAHAPQARATRR